MAGISILKSEAEVGAELDRIFGVTKEALLDIVFAAATARNDAVSNDPKSAAGLFSYIYGTRAIRELFLPKGWDIDRTDNVEATLNPENNLRVIFQNVDTAADPLREPKAISGKGAAAKRIVANGQRNLFAEFDAQDLNQINADTWFLCVSDDGFEVRAEISCPIAVENGQFSGFHTRIFLLASGEWEIHAFNSDTDELPEDDIEINISRK